MGSGSVIIVPSSGLVIVGSGSVVVVPSSGFVIIVPSGLVVVVPSSGLGKTIVSHGCSMFVHSSFAPSDSSGGGKKPSWPSGGGKKPSWPSGGGKKPSWPSGGGKKPSWPSGGGKKTTGPSGGGKKPSWPSGGGKKTTWPSGGGEKPPWPSGTKKAGSASAGSVIENPPGPRSGLKVPSGFWIGGAKAIPELLSWNIALTLATSSGLRFANADTGTPARTSGSRTNDSFRSLPISVEIPAGASPTGPPGFGPAGPC